MEPQDQSESDAPDEAPDRGRDKARDEAQAVPASPRKWWKAPLRWPAQAIAGVRRTIQYVKDYRRWSGQFLGLVKANKVMTLIVLTSVIAIVLPVFTFLKYQSKQREIALSAPVKAEQILEALERGDNEKTKTLAKRMMSQTTAATKDAGVAPFALGTLAALEGETMKGKSRAPQFLLASRYLAEANGYGFPEKHRAEGLYLYGKSLYEIGEFEKCRAVLLKALKIAPEHKTEIYLLLANAYLNDPKPKLGEAMAQNTVFLADKKLSPADRLQGLLQKARLELRLDKFDDCRATLKQIPENSKECAAATVIAGQVSMREAELLRGKDGVVAEDNQAKFREKYLEAIKTLRLAGTRAEPGSEPLRQAMYLIGVCFMETADNRAATDQFTRLHKIFPDSIEGAAASLQEAELSRRMGHDLEMLSSYRRVLGGLDKSIPYFNPWLPPAELKARLMNAYQQYLAKYQFEICLQLVGLMKAVIPADQSRLMQADLHSKWGQFLMSSAEKISRNKRESMRRLAREQFRRAGQDYVVLAKLYLDKREYSDQIWNAATSYLQGHNYTRAASLLKEYMQTEVQRRRPEALDSLGEALLCLGDYDGALDSLKECIDLFPRDAASCHARLLAAQAAREKGDVPLAEKMLLANLNGDYLTPAGKEWRDSLFLLGEILHDAGRYAEASRRLEEAVERYPELPETIQARYLLADSCSHIAMTAEDDLKKDLSGSSRATQTKIIHENYEKALEQYQIIRDKLGNNRDLAELSPSDKTMLRNSIFAIGDVLFAEGRYEAAIKAYDVATNRYQNRPEVLAAYVQKSNAYQRLDRPQDAHNALLQAKLLLERMKPDVPFDDVSIYSRQQWNDRLQELIARG